MRLQAISRFYYTKDEIRLNCRKSHFIHFMKIKFSLFFIPLFLYNKVYTLFYLKDVEE